MKYIQPLDQKYTYQIYETTNIMSYADSAIGHPDSEKISSWHWQWKIAKKHTK